jgi:CubicO group peptidase (beta-lactamase class C family)
MVIALVIAVLVAPKSGVIASVASDRWDWLVATPQSQGLHADILENLWNDLAIRRTNAFLVIRNDAVVFERYGSGFTRSTPHHTASLAKALVCGVSLSLSMDDGRIRADDLAADYVDEWKDDPVRRTITVRQLATHTSGIEDAESNGLPHEQLDGWKGDFWKGLPPPNDPFSISRDLVPVLDPPGTQARYSNPGVAMLSYCVTSSLRGPNAADIRTLLRTRVMEPMGIAADEWTIGYGTTFNVDGLPLVASWGGGNYSPNATARVGRLMLRNGDWNGERLLSESVVRTATTHAGLPNNSGLGWWVNRDPDGSRHWDAVPDDAFWGAGAGHQLLFVVPSLNLIVVRYGGDLNRQLDFDAALETHIVNPLMTAVASRRSMPYPRSRVIRDVMWAPPESVVRQAHDSDNWPLTWMDNNDLFTAYGDGFGFDPKVSAKLSLGFARVAGSPEAFQGVNVRSESGERKGDGASGSKASGLLMVDGVLYMCVRNEGNSRLAWSLDRGATWDRSPWRFEESFGCPTFLNFGKNYNGVRDDYVYIYSPDADDAYTPANRMVLARVPKDRIRERASYEFFTAIGKDGEPRWTDAVERRGAVFENPGRCYRSSVSYNAGLNRYLWCQIIPNGDTRFRGGFAVYDAPEPWGPWTTAFYTELWDIGPGETNSFPTKWMSLDGKTLYLVFSGNDDFAVRQATIVLW